MSVIDGGFDDGSVLVLFAADTDPADWAETWFELFLSGAWAGAESVGGFAPATLVFQNQAGPWPSTIPAGTPWRIVAAPPAVQSPESGVTG